MGQYQYRLKSLADDELLAGLSSVVGRRNQVTAEFLAYLAELDERHGVLPFRARAIADQSSAELRHGSKFGVGARRPMPRVCPEPTLVTNRR